VNYSELPLFEEASSTLWNNYVDSCHLGVYFSHVTLDKFVATGPLAGWQPGTIVKPHPEFLGDTPYRRHDARIEAVSEGYGEASAVWYRGVQYFSFDPLVVKQNCEFPVRWAGLSNTDRALFVEIGKYSLGREVRRSYFVPPRTKQVRVWFRGNRRAEEGKFILSPAAGGTYKLRPSRSEKSRLISKYGSRAVPQNFHKYTEEQIRRKAELLSRVEQGGWLYSPNNIDAEHHVREAYKSAGELSEVDWKALRQLAKPGDIEHDPTGEGLFIRIIPATEIFDDARYLLKAMKILERDGWGFFAAEVIRDASRVRKRLLTAAIT